MVRNSKTYTWVTVWSAVCLPIILWDASYLFFRSVTGHSSYILFFALTLAPQSTLHGWRGPPLDLARVWNLPRGGLCALLFISLERSLSLGRLDQP